jgi:Fe2+ or Zn2+ uptake regulation protein
MGITTTNSEGYATYLRSKGYRLTPQRLAILRILDEAGHHMSPAEVYRQALLIIPGLTEATIYRTLNFLCHEGLVLAAHMGSGQLVYEIAGHNHHHLICRDCGHILEIDHSALEDLYKGFQERTGYQIDSIHVTFFGLCPECQPERMILDTDQRG